MALSDCSYCWETPCVCGWEYKTWSTKKIEEQIEMLQKVLNDRKISPKDDVGYK